MSKFDRKKFRKEVAKEELEKAIKDPYQDFQGSAGELAFLKFSDFMSKYRNHIFVGVAVFSVALIVTMFFFEYRDYSVKQTTIKFEELEKEIQKTKEPASVDEKIKKYDSFLSSNSADAIRYRTSKVLSDLYIEKGDYTKAAEVLEPVAKEIDTPIEVKAYYYYLCGTYREHSNNLEKAVENFTVAASVLGSNRETPSFYSWVHFNLGRLQLSVGKKEAGLQSLKKVINLETSSTEPSIQRAKKLATYLIIKTNKE
jgi:tetratricopeptide (TPR) repeat protein